MTPPNRPGTPTTTFRLDPALIAAAKAKAAGRGKTMVDVVRQALRNEAGESPPSSVALEWCADFIEHTSHETYGVVLREHQEAATWLREYVEEET